jgi:hypothetical protein
LAQGIKIGVQNSQLGRWNVDIAWIGCRNFSEAVVQTAHTPNQDIQQRKNEDRIEYQDAPAT